jgi:hypothetical protein
MSEEMLMYMEKGALDRIRELAQGVRAHNHCDLDNEMGCILSQDQLAQRYGSLAAAQAEGMYPVDCSEDLAYLYSALSEQQHFLFQARYLRSVRDEVTALPTRRQSQKTSSVSLLGLGSTEPITADSAALFNEENKTWEPVDSRVTSTGSIPTVVVDKPKVTGSHKLITTKGK